MDNILLKLILGASLLQLGLDLTKLSNNPSRNGWNQIQHASHKVLQINWKPISIFPEQARRFQPSSKK